MPEPLEALRSDEAYDDLLIVELDERFDFSAGIVDDDVEAEPNTASCTNFAFCCTEGNSYSCGNTAFCGTCC